MRGATVAWLVVVVAGIVLLIVGGTAASEESRTQHIPDPPAGFVFDELPLDRKLHRVAIIANSGGWILIVVGVFGAAIAQFKAPPLASRAPGFPMDRPSRE